VKGLLAWSVAEEVEVEEDEKQEEVVLVDEQDARDEMTQRVGIRDSGPAALPLTLAAS
jgi:hypothetical protein